MRLEGTKRDLGMGSTHRLRGCLTSLPQAPAGVGSDMWWRSQDRKLDIEITGPFNSQVSGSHSLTTLSVCRLYPALLVI